MNNDDATQTNLAWRICQDDAPVLPVFSQITSRDMEIDPWYVFPVGEVESNGLTYRTQGSPLRRYNGKKVPKGLPSDHYCGTPSDFASGGTLDQVSPPVQYGGFGFPSCCNPPKAALGGMGLGGLTRLVMVQTGVPGATCADAGVMALNTTYSWTAPPRLQSDWWVFSGATGNYTLNISESPNITMVVGFWTGSGCPPTVVGQTGYPPFNFPFTVTSGNSWWFTVGIGVDSEAGTPYTLQVVPT